MRLTIDSKFEDANYIVIERGFNAWKYHEKHPFKTEYDARTFYQGGSLNANIDMPTNQQIESFTLYERCKVFGKLMIWKPVEKRVNIRYKC